MLKFTAMEDRIIHGTQFWTSTNIADGLNALTTCVEAWVILSLFWRSGSSTTDDILCGLYDVGLQLEGVSGATGRVPHKCLATTLGLD